MSTGIILPVPKSLFLCDGTLGFSGGKIDLMGLFHGVTALTYPHQMTDWVIFAQLLGGLGNVPFNIDIRQAQTGQLVYISNVHHLRFPNRDTLAQLVYTVQGATFPQDGIYLVELYCDGHWIADTTLLLH